MCVKITEVHSIHIAIKIYITLSTRLKNAFLTISITATQYAIKYFMIYSMGHGERLLENLIVAGLHGCEPDAVLPLSKGVVSGSCVHLHDEVFDHCDLGAHLRYPTSHHDVQKYWKDT